MATSDKKLRVRPDKVRWKAQWIWSSELDRKPNTHAFFRRRFVCPSSVRTARLMATAGHFCHIYLNGRLVGRGPDRSYFRDKIYHLYDVTKFLRSGRNVLAMDVYYVGENLPGCVERHASGPPGCLAQLEVNSKPLVWTDAAWRTVPNAAYSNLTSRCSTHREWKEEYTVSRAIPHWQALSFDDSSWPTAAVVAPAEGGPWARLVPKTTPEMTAELLAPLNMYLTNSGGDCPWGYQGWLFYNPIADVPPRLAGDLRIDNAHQERQELLFDMGRVVAGYPRIEIADSLGGTIRVYHGDSLDMTHWDTIHLGKGPLTWSPFTLRGGRYFRLEITGAHHPVAIRSVRWVRRNFPVEHRGRFECSDERLNAIWNLCALTAETCGLEHITDCVVREQALWMMDYRFQGPQHAYYFGETDLVEKGFRQFATLQLTNGHILGYGPSCRPLEKLVADPRLPEEDRPHDWFGFNFYFVIAVWEHYQYTRHSQFMTDLLPVCARCLDYYAKAERNGFAAPGEVPGEPYVEWGYDQRFEGISAFHQALYYGALTAYHALCRAAGRNREAGRVARKAAELEKRFFSTFVDPSTGRIAADWRQGERLFHDRTQPYAAVLRFFDHIPDAVRRAALEVIEERKVHLSKTGLGISLTAEALFRHGRDEAAVKLIRDYYGAILDAGLPQVPEVHDMTQRRGADSRWSPAYSRCHSYASLAGVLLQRHILGADVQGRVVTLSPSFGSFSEASGVIPTVAGDVAVLWRRQGNTVQLFVRAPRPLKVHYVPRPGEAGVRVAYVRRQS